jgi:hypothetical protein
LPATYLKQKQTEKIEMSESKHTPGPWHESKTGNHQGLIIAETGENIAVAYDEKDAPIIAAAPDMLAALKALLNAANQYQDLRDRNGAAVFNAYAAIAKAEGH